MTMTADHRVRLQIGELVVQVSILQEALEKEKTAHEETKAKLSALEPKKR
jgi:hypothetical protein